MSVSRLAPCRSASRSKAPPTWTASQRLRLATTDQVGGLYEVFSERRRLAVLLGAFAGLSPAEACGLRVEDVAFLEREIRPGKQYPDEPLKTEMRYTPIPVADTLLEMIAARLERWPSTWVLTGDEGDQLRPREVQREMRAARRRSAIV
jgi:integrase